MSPLANHIWLMCSKRPRRLTVELRDPRFRAAADELARAGFLSGTLAHDDEVWFEATIPASRAPMPQSIVDRVFASGVDIDAIHCRGQAA